MGGLEKARERPGIGLGAKLLLLTMAATLIPLLVLLGISITTSNRMANGLIRDDLEAKALMVASSIQEYLLQRESDARLISQADVLESTDTEGMAAYFAEVREACPPIAAALAFGPDGVCLAGSGVPAAAGRSISEIFPDSRPLFDAALSASQGEVLVSEAFPWGESLGMLYLTPVTDASNTQVLRVLTLVASARYITESVSAFNQAIIGDRYVYLLRKSGEVVFTNDPEVGPFAPLPDLRAEEGLLSLLSRQDSVGAVNYRDAKGGLVLAAYADLKEAGRNKALDWSLLAVAPEKDITAPVRSASLLMGLVGLALAALGLLGSLVFIRRITGPVRSMAAALKDIAEGEGDLTRSIALGRSRDELGEMAAHFNATLGAIAKLVRNISEQARSLGESGDELASNMVEASASVNQIAANIEGLKGLSARQTEGVEEAGAAAGRIAEGISSLDRDIADQSASIIESSSSVEEMVSNIASVASILRRNSETIDGLIGASESGKARMDELAELMAAVARESEGLVEATTLIQELASRTNLLAMNAAIEAAHAGEFGKGFAVVADEIRGLAENSAEQGKSIAEVLDKLKNSIARASGISTESQREFQGIWEATKTTREQEEVIKAAMEEQSSGGQQILQAVKSMNEITVRVRDGSVAMARASREIAERMAALASLTAEMEMNMGEMADGTNQVNQAVSEARDLGIKNRESIKALNAEVGRFKT